MTAPKGEQVLDADGIITPRWLKFLNALQAAGSYQPLDATLTFLSGKTVTNWAAYTPSVTSGTGTITTLGTVTGRWAQINKTVFFEMVIAITTNGTAATDIIASLPVATNSVTTACGRESTSTGKMLQGLAIASSTQLAIFNYDGTYPGGSGTTLNMSGTYEVA